MDKYQPQQPGLIACPSSCHLSDVLSLATGVVCVSGAWQLGSLGGKMGKISICLKLALPWYQTPVCEYVCTQGAGSEAANGYTSEQVSV